MLFISFSVSHGVPTKRNKFRVVYYNKACSSAPSDLQTSIPANNILTHCKIKF